MKLGVNSQGGPRGATKFELQNWVMPMAFRRWARGSPQLFQTGESYQGKPFVDRQHPHDLFME